jgi:hypothetical protein
VEPAAVGAERQLEREVRVELVPAIEAREAALGLEVLIVLRHHLPAPPIDDALSIDLARV